MSRNVPFQRESKSKGNSKSVWSFIKRTLFTPMGTNKRNGPKKNFQVKKHEDMQVETSVGKHQSVFCFLLLIKYIDFDHDFGTFQSGNIGQTQEAGPHHHRENNNHEFGI